MATKGYGMRKNRRGVDNALSYFYHQGAYIHKNIY